MKLLKLSAAFAAMCLIAGVNAQAWALDAFWHGVRSQEWSDGIVGGVSNWYSKAPPTGIARDVPDGVATFAAGAMTFDVNVKDDRKISVIEFEPNAPRYGFHIFPGAHLTIRGAGVVQNSDATHNFGLAGTIRFWNSARVITNTKTSPQFDVFANGSLQFQDSSSGGRARVIVNNDGELTFFENASADQMTVLTRNGGTTFFLGRSDGEKAQFRVFDGGILAFDITKGPAGKRMLTARQVTNDGLTRLGINTITLQRNFDQGSTGSLAINASAARVGRMVADQVKLAGNLTVTGGAGVTPGQYVLIQSTTRTGKFDTTSFVSFPAGMSRHIKYTANRVILVLQ